MPTGELLVAGPALLGRASLPAQLAGMVLTMADRLIVQQAGRLLDVLAQEFADKSKNTWSKNTLRQRLRLGCVAVNGRVVERAAEMVAVGDIIEVHSKASVRSTQSMAALNALFEDEYLLAIDKPAGLLSVGTDGERDRTALSLARQAIRHGSSSGDLWPVHRLDRETSGVLLFARSREARDQIQAGWHNTKKIYTAVVEGVVDPAAGTIDQPLWEDKNLRVRVGARDGAKEARTRYQTVLGGRTRSHLEVHLDTGRKHQIRAHLAWLGHPVVGDSRYGQPDVRLCLHARQLVLPHPVAGHEICIEAEVPSTVLSALR